MSQFEPQAPELWWEDAPKPDGRGAERRVNRLTWLVVAALAFLAFELTANPALALALGCLKFGWNDFRTAHRLRRIDPDRQRGRVCARFYRAWGLWKISIVATVLMFAIVCVHGPFGPAGGNAPPGQANVPPASFLTACLLAMLGFGASSVVSSVAIVSALRRRVKVWVGSRVNRAKTVILSALISNLTVVGIIGLCALASAIPMPRALSSPLAFTLAFVLFFLGLPTLILVVLEALTDRIVCQTAQRAVGPSRSTCQPGHCNSPHQLFPLRQERPGALGSTPFFDTRSSIGKSRMIRSRGTRGAWAIGFVRRQAI